MIYWDDLLGIDLLGMIYWGWPSGDVSLGIIRHDTDSSLVVMSVATTHFNNAEIF